MLSKRHAPTPFLLPLHACVLHVVCINQVWNDSLVILRELCYSCPELANRLFGTDLVLFLFTLMSQPLFFDHAVGLIEEILADQVSEWMDALLI